VQPPFRGTNPPGHAHSSADAAALEDRTGPTATLLAAGLFV
jgi:hypothetical protein